MKTEDARREMVAWFKKNAKTYEKVEVETLSGITELKTTYETIQNNKIYKDSFVVNSSLVKLLTTEDIHQILQKFLNHSREEAGKKED